MAEDKRLKSLRSSHSSFFGKVGGHESALNELLSCENQLEELTQTKRKFDEALTKCIDSCKLYLDAIPKTSTEEISRIQSRCEDLLSKQKHYDDKYYEYKSRYDKSKSTTGDSVERGQQSAPSNLIGREESSFEKISIQSAAQTARLLEIKAEQLHKEAELRIKLMNNTRMREIEEEQLKLQISVSQAYTEAEIARVEAGILDAELANDTVRSSFCENPLERPDDKSEHVRSTAIQDPQVQYQGAEGKHINVSRKISEKLIKSEYSDIATTLPKQHWLNQTMEEDPEAGTSSHRVKLVSDNVEFHSQTNIPSTSNPIYQNKHVIENSNVDHMAQALLSITNMMRQGFTLPKRELQTFDGDHLRYFQFIRNFESIIEKQVADAETRLSYLVQLCSGKPRSEIEFCESIRPHEVGYERARKILHQNYGQKHIVVSEHLKSICEGPRIKPGDTESLSKLASDMINCEIVLAEYGYICGLDSDGTLLKIFLRLPKYLQANIRDVAFNMIKNGDELKFSNLSEIIQSAASKNKTIFGKAFLDDNKSKPNSLKPKTFSSFYTKLNDSDRYNARSCLLCSNNHPLWKCEVFKEKSVDQRVKIIRGNKLCYNCFGRAHMVRECKCKSVCKECQKKHHTLIHRQNSSKDETDINESREHDANADPTKNRINEVNAMGSVCNTNSTFSNVRLKVAPVFVWGNDKCKPLKVYAFLDEGADTSLCTNNLMHRLGLKGAKEQCEITTVNGICKQDVHKVSMRIQGIYEPNSLVLSNVLAMEKLPNMTNSIPSERDVKRYPHLKGLNFPKLDSNEIDMLIGADCIEAHIVSGIRNGKPGEPVAMHTGVGWAIMGPETCSMNKTSRRFINFIHADNAILHQQMVKMYNQEFNISNTSNEKSQSVEDKRAHSIMNESLTKVDGHFQMKLPWKEDNAILPPNRDQALKRLNSLKRRFQRDPKLFEKYREKMQDYLENGYAEKVPEKELHSNKRTWYIPHHCTGQKFRVVFDCAARGSDGVSLNDKLLKGPDNTNSLLSVLIRFREESVAVVADIRGMFHQVMVDPEDRDSLRFLWWPDHDYDKPPEDYRMKVFVFGSTSSPSCASFALRKVAEVGKNNTKVQVTDTILKSFYVDDLLKSLKSVCDAQYLIKELRNVLWNVGRFYLTKFFSNEPKALDGVSEEDKACCMVKVALGESPSSKALGIYWNTVSDNFEVKVKIKTNPLTRRGILSTVSQIFDPLGWVQPFILPMKRLMQELCIESISWDETISDEKQALWQRWIDMLPNLENVVIPRCYKPQNFNPSNIQLHIFSDASQLYGYGAVAYLRMVSDNGVIHCSFVMGKSRVNPLKPVTVPRLELCAAVVAVQMSKQIIESLEYTLNSILFWTDSMTVLKYISNTATRFQTFVANRIALIHENSDSNQWRYVPSTANPADISSRGLWPNEICKANRWFFGADFLWRNENEWPEQAKLSTADEDLEWRPRIEMKQNFLKADPEPDLLVQLLERYSCYIRLRRAIAWLLRFKTCIIAKFKLKSTKMKFSKYLTSCELDQSTLEIAKIVQRQTFGTELKRLHDHNKDEKYILQPKRQLTKSSSLSRVRNLSPVLIQGVLRVGGRLQKAPLPFNIKHQIIMPNQNHVTDLIIRYYHEMQGHSGVLHVLSCIRETFWILQGQSAVKRVLRTCLPCKVREAKVGEQIMSPLPFCRVNPEQKPFESVGIDYMGPLLVKVGRSQAKRYACVFSCLATRAIHVEVAFSLSTSSFLQAFRRFVSRRGKVKFVYSDNGTNFVGAEREMREGLKRWNQSQIHNCLSQQGIQWHFNPPYSSHQAGAVERMIRSVRRILHAITLQKTLHDEDLQTLLVEAESILNNRPLVPLSDDPRDLNALTPNSILIARLESTCLSSDVFIQADGFRTSWRRTQLIADEFWRRWIKEYLPLLQKRQKWLRPVRNFAVGDLVLLLDEMLRSSNPRGVWIKGIVQEVYPDKDGDVRRVKIRTCNSEYIRDIRKLCLLEAMS